MRPNYFLIAVLITTITFLATLAIYSELPARIPTHWNALGEISAYSSKPVAFLMPAVMLAIVLLFAAIPWLSRRNYEVDTFRSPDLFMMVVLISFMAYAHALTLRAALAQPVNMNRTLLGATFLMFILFGNGLGRFRRDFFIGVHNPCTLPNEKVWQATHRFAAKVFVAAGALGLFCVVVLPGTAIGFGIFLAAVLYSLPLQTSRAPQQVVRSSFQVGGKQP